MRTLITLIALIVLIAILWYSKNHDRITHPNNPPRTVGLLFLFNSDLILDGQYIGCFIAAPTRGSRLFVWQLWSKKHRQGTYDCVSSGLLGLLGLTALTRVSQSLSVADLIIVVTLCDRKGTIKVYMNVLVTLLTLSKPSITLL